MVEISYILNFHSVLTLLSVVLGLAGNKDNTILPLESPCSSVCPSVATSNPKHTHTLMGQSGKSGQSGQSVLAM